MRTHFKNGFNADRDDNTRDHGLGHNSDHGRGWGQNGGNPRRNNDDDKHDGRGHGNGDHNGDGRPDNGVGGNVPPPPPPPPAPTLSLTALGVSNAATAQTLAGTEAGDTLRGGQGDDTLTGGAGDDVLFGDGSGTVTVPLDIDASLDNAADPSAFSIVISGMPNGAMLSAGIDNGDGTWTLTPDQLAGLTITGSDETGFTLNIVATATDGSGLTASTQLAVTLAPGNADLLDGGEGNDILDGGAGNDTLIGGEGNDTFIAGSGDDSYFGGEGFDTIDFSQGTATDYDGVYVNLETGIVSGVSNGTGDDTLYGIEGVIGSNGGDLIFGNAIANSIDGGAGDDVIIGGAGADTLTGGLGSDTFLIRYDDLIDDAGNWLGADTITDFEPGDMLMLQGFSGLTLMDDGASSTIYAMVNGQSVQLAVLEGFSGMSLDDMAAYGMIYY